MPHHANFRPEQHHHHHHHHHDDNAFSFSPITLPSSFSFATLAGPRAWNLSFLLAGSLVARFLMRLSSAALFDLLDRAMAEHRRKEHHHPPTVSQSGRPAELLKATTKSPQEGATTLLGVMLNQSQVRGPLGTIFVGDHGPLTIDRCVWILFGSDTIGSNGGNSAAIKGASFTTFWGEV
jgi:hypothetical protein